MARRITPAVPTDTLAEAEAEAASLAAGSATKTDTTTPATATFTMTPAVGFGDEDWAAIGYLNEGVFGSIDGRTR
ncbi:hypothetical protein J3F82_002637, partial [Coemansia sp. RSA 637]